MRYRALAIADYIYNNRRVVIDPLAPMRKENYVNSKMNTFNDYYIYCKEKGDDFIGYEADFDGIANHLKK